MDRNYIEREQLVERYLAGELTVREAREFEKYLLEHPAVLNELPIPVRLKARLSRRPHEDSETGIFQTIPSSATRVAAEVGDEGFDYEDEKEEQRRSSSGGVSRAVVFVLLFALIGALGAVVFFAMRSNNLSNQLRSTERASRALQLQAPASVQKYRIQPVKAQPAQPTLQLGWLAPPQLLELHIDVSEGKATQFQVTLDKVDGGRLMQIRRLTRDSNRELRMALNSSAFGPGEYLLRLDAYNWRGELQEYGWVRVGLE
jgi:hypothetical protein